MPRRRILLTVAVACVLIAGGARQPTAPARAQTDTTPAQSSGCVADGHEVRRHADDTTDKVVALTFDDGPSEFTPQVLSILHRADVPATFFELGKNMAGREDVMRQIIASGSEIGDHTTHHVRLTALSSAGIHSELARTQAQIETITGFQTCLFRPPYGLLNGTVNSIGAKLGMLAILWSDDSKDFTTPGTSKIYSNVIKGVRPGGIVIMHDGGGDRSQTVAALPRVISTLKARGYTFATVSRLLALQQLSTR